MQIYVHVYGQPTRHILQPWRSPDDLKIIAWMGRDDDDAMVNWQLLARELGVPSQTHIQMQVVTKSIIAHMDLIDALDPDATFRPESIYVVAHSIDGEPAAFFPIRATDVDDARSRFLAEYKGPPEAAETGIRGIANIGESLGRLKHKIRQYFGQPA